jgi:hypothetical protein
MYICCNQHTAKLTAFFNCAPKDSDLADLPADSNFHKDVPMFVKQNNSHYAYFSDSIIARVPQNINEY